MSFFDDVRKNRVADPLKDSYFDRALWETIAQSAQSSDDDRMLAQAGIFVFEQRKQIQYRLRQTLQGIRLPSEEALRMLIGFENLLSLNITKLLDQHVEQSWVTSHRRYLEAEILGVRGPNGSVIDAEELLEEGVEATARLLRESPWVTNDAHPSQK